MDVMRYRKFISFLLIITMMIFGICFDTNVDSYSFFACEDSYEIKSVQVSDNFQYNTSISAGISGATLDQMFVHEITHGREVISNAGRRVFRNNIRHSRNEINAFVISAGSLLLLLYFLLVDLCRELHRNYNNIIIISYIHRKDGKKITALSI